MHVHILGSVALNGGDAAILLAQRHVIRTRWPQAEITASDTHSTVVGKYVPEVRFTPFLRPSAVRPGRVHRFSSRAGGVLDRLSTSRYRAVASLYGQGHRRLSWALARGRLRQEIGPLLRADVVAYTGGTSLTDNYGLQDKIFDLDLARRARRPLIFMPQSAGPFRKVENRQGLRPIFAAADRILLRDDRSLAHVVDVGADPRLSRVVPDIVFALARDDARLTAAPAATDGPQLAVSVREWAHFRDKDTDVGMRDYADSLRAAVTRAVRDRGAHVTFVSTCQGRPEYVRDDSIFARAVVDGLPQDVQASVVVDAAARRPEELIDFLAGFTAMLSTRLHGAISAVCSAVPTATIAYEYKTTEVWKQLGLEQWSIEIDDVTPDALGRLTVELLDAAPAVRAVLHSSVPPLRDAAMAVAGDVEAVSRRVR